MIFMGVLMLTGKLSTTSASLSGTGQEENVAEQAEEESAEDAEEVDHTDGSEGEKLTPAVDFNLTDQYGNTHTLSQYKGKTIFLNFWVPGVRLVVPKCRIFRSFMKNLTRKEKMP